MLDIRWIRENPAALDEALTKRGAEPASARLLQLDRERRDAVQALQDAQTRRNSASKEIGQAKAQKDEARAEALMTEVAALKESMKAGEDAERSATEHLEAALATLPNVPLDDVPVGPDESANVEARHWGEPRELADAKEHFELGEAMGLMDFGIAAKISGSRFVVLKGQLARMERALGQFMLDLHTQEHGYTEVQPPLLVKDDALYGTAQLPKFAEDLFKTSRQLGFEERADLVEAMDSSTAMKLASVEFLITSDDEKKLLRRRYLAELKLEALNQVLNAPTHQDHWLIPTAEVPLTNLVREQVLMEEEFPLRFTALTPCFRSEAGSAGRDTRGMLRQHQFDKVELVSITTPEKSLEEHERMTMCAEEVLKRLDLAYRVMTLSTGDMGFAAQKTYDLEVWLPGQKAYREISSCSVCGDFQARRMNARYRPAEEKQPRFVHTLNGSGVAVGRALIAVMETYQNSDGTITVPDALRPYMGGLEAIG